MAILGSIVLPSSHFAAVKITKIMHGSRIGFQSVGHDDFRFSVALQRSLDKRQSRRFIPFLRDIALKNFAFVINRSPKVVTLAVDLYEHLVEVLAPMMIASHVGNTLTSDLTGKHRSKPVPPQSNRLVANVDPAFE